jgi:Zn-finger nucleic acid-binding protein
MKCPTCDVDLVMADRVGVEIDYCPKCRGVWLDRGEIDKIIERSAGAPAPVPVGAGYGSPDRFRDHGHHDEHGRSGGHGEHGQGQHGKRPFWREIFD